MHLERLKIMADYVHAMPRPKFNLNVVRETRSCGSIGCVMGTAPLVPQFKDLIRYSDEFGDFSVVGRPSWIGYYEAAQVFFELDDAVPPFSEGGLVMPIGESGMDYEFCRRRECLESEFTLSPSLSKDVFFFRLDCLLKQAGTETWNGQPIITDEMRKEYLL